MAESIYALPCRARRNSAARIDGSTASGCAVRLVAVRRRARLGATFGDRDQRRPQHAFTDHVAGLHDLDHGSRGDGWVRDLVHRLLKIRIEFLARWIEFLAAA